MVRIDRLRARMDGAGIANLLVTDRVNALYLSAFHGSAGSLVVTPTQLFILADFRYHERVKREVDPAWELVDSSGVELGDLLGKLPLNGAMGFEASTVTVAEHARLAEAGIELTPTSGLVEALRAVKEPGEVEAIRRAQRLGERIFEELLPMVGSSTTELDLAVEIECRARRHGASACSFPPIIATGPNSAQPHASPSRTAIVPGAPLTIDLGVVLDDYCGDMTRTVFFRDCPPKWREIYELVRRAKDAAFAAIRPGVPARKVDAVARRMIEAAGYGDNFRHGLGHGVGLPFKGAPVLHWASDDVLEAGNVASDEPGIYLPGEGGIRIEDLCVVTETGAENLNTLSCELRVVG